MVSRSCLFTAYNCARKLGVDRPRLNKALGLALHGSWNYVTTLEQCSCPDWQYRGAYNYQPCKHLIARALIEVCS